MIQHAEIEVELRIPPEMSEKELHDKVKEMLEEFFPEMGWDKISTHIRRR